jgi:hypothetical protein
VEKGLISKKSIKQFIITRVLRRNLPLSLVRSDYTVPGEIKILDSFPVNKMNTICCNLNLDDLCPKYFDEYGLDFGGHPGEGVALEFENLLKDYPYIGVTHFVIPFCQIQKTTLWRNNSDNRYNISSPNHQEWLKYYKDLSKIYNIEFAQHGYCHRQDENVFFTRHTEFAYKNETESFKAIKKGLEILKQAGITIYGFRQPGWDINSDLSICYALQRLCFQYIAGSSYDAGFNAGMERISNYFPSLINGIINFPQNILLDWPLERIKNKMDRIVSMDGFISIKGHFVNSGMPNSFSAENISKLRRALDYLTKQHEGRISYLTLKDATIRFRQYPALLTSNDSNQNES